MTYGQFLLILLGPPLVCLGVLTRRSLRRSTVTLLLILAAVAVIYTAPWDNLLVAERVWTFSRPQVLGALIGRVPLEEYLFYILQVAVTGLWAVWLSNRMRPE